MDPSQAWIEELAALRAAGRPCAVVVVTSAQGSAPRDAGARMIVADGVLHWGTIGGGNLERQAIERASQLLAGGRAVSESVDYPLSEKAGQCCGGAVTLFFEAFPWRRTRLVIFGAGHVAQAIAGLSGYLGSEVLLIDSREEAEIQPALPREREYELLSIDEPQAEVAGLEPGTLVLVMTHSHALDLEIVAEAIQRGDLGYLGLIGSTRKWARFRQRLEQRGFAAEQIGRVRCPIGVSKKSKEPRAIAISVAAELLDVMSGGE